MAFQPLFNGCSAVVNAISSHDRILKQILQDVRQSVAGLGGCKVIAVAALHPEKAELGSQAFTITYRIL